MAPRISKPAATPPAKAAAKPDAAAKGKAAKSAPKAAAAPKDAKAAAFKLKDLVGAVAKSTGGKPPEVRKAVGATLAALAAALQTGADLTLPPLGRARVVKSEDRNGTTVMTLKLRLGGADKGGDENADADKRGAKQALADDGEDG